MNRKVTGMVAVGGHGQATYTGAGEWAGGYMEGGIITGINGTHHRRLYVAVMNSGNGTQMNGTSNCTSKEGYLMLLLIFAICHFHVF